MWLEWRAALVYVLRGYRVLAWRWRTRGGEVDVVVRRGRHVVFVEVRGRAAGAVVTAVDSVTVAKQRRVYRAAQAFLRSHRLGRGYTIRFDVYAVDGHWLAPARIIEHAFEELP